MPIPIFDNVPLVDISPLLILIIALATSVAFALRTEKTFPKVIIAIQWLSILNLLLVSDSVFKIIAGIGFCFSFILILGYGFFSNNLTILQRGILYGIVVPVAISFLFKFESWPYAAQISLLMLIPILLLIVALIYRTRLKNEIGFLILPAAFALLEFMEFFQEWHPGFWISLNH